MVNSDSKGIKNECAKMNGRSVGSVMDPGDGRTPSRPPASGGLYSLAISHEFQHSSLSTTAIVASSLAGVRGGPAFTSTVSQFMFDRDANGIVEAQYSLDDVDQDNVLRSLVYQKELDC